MASIYSTILHEKTDYSKSFPSVTPIFQVSGFETESVDFYARKSTPNGTELESIFKKLECSNFALSVASGMSAIFMCLNLLSPGARVLICSKVYGCSYKLFQKYCNKHKIILDIFDLSDNIVASGIQEKYDMCFFETPTNPFLSIVDIKLVSDACKKQNSECIVVVDNTWATPLYQKPLEHGADLVVYSGTKYFGGHSDVMCGFLTTNKEELYEGLFDLRFYGGLSLTPYHAWLIRRSLQTFKIRMEQQSKTTLKLKKELEKESFINKIYYPKIDGKQLTGYGGIIFIEVDNDTINNYDSIIKKLTLFGTGTGMACVTSMIAQPYTGSHASLSAEEKEKMGIKENLVRLCFGLEDADDLIADLQNAFHL